ncbi:hypothetical protein [Methylicorpusculum sp.]|uniref:hypothetical protein n=1 Tax=Methylicorpusculum sp. TaxID=2713644 RepID=UPI002AB8E8A6|nr:hypothetical protein [Methylicorpusculum sp.]MDZ4153752.1 hypothetical protein [Methylicorpusculum sp.]
MLWPTAVDHERLLRRSETQKTILGHAAALEKGVWRVRVDCDSSPLPEADIHYWWIRIGTGCWFVVEYAK